MLGLALSVSLLASAPTVGVAVGKRSGTSQKTALLRAERVRDVALPEGPRPGVTDATDCAGKRPCLVARARGQGLTLLLVVETATVIGDPVVSVVLLSVEEDGKVLGQALVESKEAELEAALRTALVPIAEEVARQLKPATSTPTERPSGLEVAPPPPPPVEPPIAPPPPPPVTTAERPAARWVPLVVAGAVTLVGAGLFVASQLAANDLRTRMYLIEQDIDRTVAFGKWAEPAGLVTLGVGGAATLGALVLGLLWPESSGASMAPTAGGALITWSGRFP